MSDRFHPLGAGDLAAWIASELDRSGSIFGIPEPLWFRPPMDGRFTVAIHGHRVETPIGVAAGPHTQLAQNIVVAWLCGARIIELKTVQTRDRITVAKPCIDMQDEGYNIEWSQELTVEESLTQYVTAWLVVHALHRRFRFPEEAPGVHFDLSVGYDLAGLQQPNMHWFLAHAADGGEIFDRCRDAVASSLPEVLEIEVPRRIASSVTISTLHGCPPDEIGAIAEHLMETWGLHTAVKLNPTLLGFDSVNRILVDRLGWRHIAPHEPSFAADIAYGDALELLRRLADTADGLGLDFGLKLLNTLPVVNRRPDFADGGPTAFLSGRPLHAVGVELARRFTADLDGRVPISFAGGADAFNTPRLLAAGLCPVTSCSDLLRPGGYLRLGQYLEHLEEAMAEVGATNPAELPRSTAGPGADAADASRANLARYADALPGEPEVACATYRRRDTKTDRDLGLFDCVAAPCSDACSIDQAVPEYMRLVARGLLDDAAAVVSRDNPLPSILGRACHHPCEPVCTRTHLDRPLAIREIKRTITDHASPAGRIEAAANGPTVAIVGAGPCGLAAAWELARAGSAVTVFERREESGGMVSATIPGYRAGDEVVRRDLDAITSLGVRVEHGVEIGTDLAVRELFDRGFAHVVVAAGAQLGVRLGIDGEDADGVLDGLELLRRARRGLQIEIGPRAAVIGGGDVAIDCARTARRLGCAQVEILYRRSTEQMPAHPDEIRDLIAEAITIRELVAPRRVVAPDGRLRALECALMELGEPDASGRPRPIEIAGSSLLVELDTLIVAIGQRPELEVFGDHRPATSPSGYVDADPETLETSIPRLYVGGDLRHPGPSNIVEACGDGRRIARAILAREGREPGPSPPQRARPPDPLDLRRRSTRIDRVAIPRSPAPSGAGFAEIVQTLAPEAAAREAARCLDCDLVCGTCESVCPNRAILGYHATPFSAGSRTFGVVQEPQVAVVADLCNECGNCVTFCPTAGRPWADKPRIHLDRAEFEAATDNAFMLLAIGDRVAVQGRFAGRTLQVETGDRLRFAGPGCSALLDRESFEILELGGAEGNAVDLEPALVMWTLLRGLTESAPQLPVIAAEPEWVV